MALMLRMIERFEVSFKVSYYKYDESDIGAAFRVSSFVHKVRKVFR